MIKINQDLYVAYKPIAKKLPEKLFYYRKKDTSFHYFETKKGGEYLGYMCSYPIGTYNPIYYISVLRAEKQAKGAGRDLVNFAKQQSHATGCRGRVFVDAHDLDTGNHPEAFYRKMGFTCDDEERLKLIDDCVSKGLKNVPLPDYTVTPMYLDK